MADKIISLSRQKSKATSRKVTRRKVNENSRADYVSQMIRQAIHDGRYKPGERVRETEVAEWLKVSRTPVREALRRLESDGMLIFVSWRGVVVADLDRQQVSELYAMREILEGAAAKLAARHIDELEIEILVALLERMQAARNDAHATASLNRQFHDTIHVAAHNRYLVQMLEKLDNSLALLRGTTFSIDGRAQQAAREHGDIVEGIKRRDPIAAEAAARAHISAAQRARIELMMTQESDQWESRT